MFVDCFLDFQGTHLVFGQQLFERKYQLNFECSLLMLNNHVYKEILRCLWTVYMIKQKLLCPRKLFEYEIDFAGLMEKVWVLGEGRD